MIETISKRKVRITNRNNGTTGYKLQNGVTRNFAIGQSMVVDFDELELLQNARGGDYLLKNYFIIQDDDVIEELNMEVEPEYKYTEKEIAFLLAEGTLDQLEDALTFAPVGVIEIIKDMAVKTELPDTRKRKLITEKTGFNIDNAIRVRTIMNAESTPTEEDASTKRKAEPVKVEDKPTRKTNGIKIK